MLMTLNQRRAARAARARRLRVAGLLAAIVVLYGIAGRMEFDDAQALAAAVDAQQLARQEAAR